MDPNLALGRELRGNELDRRFVGDHDRRPDGHPRRHRGDERRRRERRGFDFRHRSDDRIQPHDRRLGAADQRERDEGDESHCRRKRRERHIGNPKRARARRVEPRRPQTRLEPCPEIRRRLDGRQTLHEHQAATNQHVVSRARGALADVLAHLHLLIRGTEQVDERRVAVSKLSAVHWHPRSGTPGWGVGSGKQYLLPGWLPVEALWTGGGAVERWSGGAAATACAKSSSRIEKSSLYTALSLYRAS